MYYILYRLTEEELAELEERRAKGELTAMENKLLSHCYHLADDEPVVQELKGYSH